MTRPGVVKWIFIYLPLGATFLCLLLSLLGMVWILRDPPAP